MPQVTSSTPDLMGIVSRQITPDVIRSVASQLSEDRGSTASALSAAVPSTLTALSDVASSDTGVRHLKDVIDEKRRDTAQGIDEDRSLFPSTRTEASEHASSLIENELGPRSTTIAQAVANVTGIKTASAQKLMGGVASVAVAALAKTSGSMDPGALQSMFREQRGGWVGQLPGPVASLFNGHSRPTVLERGYDERMVTGPAIRELEAPRRNWMIPLILVALALLAIPVLRGLRRPSPPSLPQRVTLPQPTQPAPAVTPPAETAPLTPEPTPPTAAVPAVEPGSTADFVAFLAGLRGDDAARVRAVAADLRVRFGDADVRVDGRRSMTSRGAERASGRDHPDREPHRQHRDAGVQPEPVAGAAPSRSRASWSIAGVEASNIETAGMGQDLPIACNDTPDGRAKNRRSEIVVTSR